MAALAGLVADYHSNSSSETGSETSSDCDESDSEEPKCPLTDDKESEKLPLPDILSNDLLSSSKVSSVGGTEETRNCSVFFNPFKAKEDAKLAILEKHVKLSERQDESRTEKGKFRKKNKRRQEPQDNNNKSRTEDGEGFKTLGKRRIGVSNSLVPPKKAMKAYERQRREERGRKAT